MRSFSRLGLVLATLLASACGGDDNGGSGTDATGGTGGSSSGGSSSGGSSSGGSSSGGGANTSSAESTSSTDGGGTTGSTTDVGGSGGTSSSTGGSTGTESTSSGGSAGDTSSTTDAGGAAGAAGDSGSTGAAGSGGLTDEELEDIVTICDSIVAAITEQNEACAVQAAGWANTCKTVASAQRADCMDEWYAGHECLQDSENLTMGNGGSCSIRLTPEECAPLINTWISCRMGF